MVVAAFGSAVTVKDAESVYLVLSATPLTVIAADNADAEATRSGTAVRIGRENMAVLGLGGSHNTVEADRGGFGGGVVDGNLGGGRNRRDVG